ncbi:MAG: hypothetical protein V1820_06790 [archaeon]
MLWRVRIGHYQEPFGEYSMELRIDSCGAGVSGPRKEMSLPEAEKFASSAAAALHSPCFAYKDQKAGVYSFEIPF